MFDNKLKPFISIDRVEINPADIKPGTITLDQYHRVRANSPGFEILYSKLDNEALIAAVQNNLANCTYPFSPMVYEYVLQNYLVLELIKRLEAKGA